MSTAVYSHGYHGGMGQTHLDYPRSDHHQRDDLVGHQDMADLTHRTIYAVYKWFERGRLPLADGPLVNGLPTWRRRTFLAWAYDQGYTRHVRTGNPLRHIHREAREYYEADAFLRAAYDQLYPVSEDQRLAG